MSYGAPNHPQTIDEPRPDVAKVMSPHLLINLLHTHERFACYLIALRNVFLLFFFVVEFFLEFFLEFCFFFLDIFLVFSQTFWISVLIV